MRPEWFLCFGGVEISNHARVATYITNVGVPGASVEVDCACPSLDTGFSLPATDPAPWYEPSRPESLDFLGFLATNMELPPVGSRGAGPAGSVGTALSPPNLAGRILQVSGTLWARSAEGMAYGERWIQAVLRGSPCTEGDCPQDDILILPACPESVGYDLQEYLRTLVGAGLVDGPVFGPISDRTPECHMQQCSFVLAASMPWFYHQPTRCLDAESLGAEALICALTTPEWMGEGTFRVELENTGSTDATNMVVTGTISLDGLCPTGGLAASVPYTFRYEIPTLAPGAKVVVDGARRRATYYNPSSRNNEPALPYINFTGPWRWPDVGPCTTMCVTIEGETGTVAVTADSYLKEL